MFSIYKKNVFLIHWKFLSIWDLFVDQFKAGAAAGSSVDVSLFPLDTVKTRLQSHAGFWKSGGFRGIYSGLLSVTIGAAPTGIFYLL